MQDAIIFDIDGTLADCKHRRHLVTGEKKDWPTFLASTLKDGPKVNVIDLCNFWFYKRYYACAENVCVLLVSGRGEEYRNDTVLWMNQNLVLYDYLFMRPEKDSRPDTEIKMEIYKRDIAPKYKVRLVVDDRTRLVKMWRSLGLECWQVADGDF